MAADILTEREILMLGRHRYRDVLSLKIIKKLNFTDSHQCLKPLTQEHFEGHTQELIVRNYINTPSNLTLRFQHTKNIQNNQI